MISGDKKIYVYVWRIQSPLSGASSPVRKKEVVQCGFMDGRIIYLKLWYFGGQRQVRPVAEKTFAWIAQFQTSSGSAVLFGGSEAISQP